MYIYKYQGREKGISLKQLSYASQQHQQSRNKIYITAHITKTALSENNVLMAILQRSGDTFNIQY